MHPCVYMPHAITSGREILQDMAHRQVCRLTGSLFQQMGFIPSFDNGCIVIQTSLQVSAPMGPTSFTASRNHTQTLATGSHTDGIAGLVGVFMVE